MLANWFSDRTIKNLLIFKGIIVLAVLLITFKQISIEEKPINAEEGNIQADSPKKVAEQSNTDLSEPTDLVEQTHVSSEAGGILDGLLELPPLKTDDKKTVGKYLTLAERAKQQVEDRLKILEKRAKNLKEIEQIITEKLNKLDQERKFFVNTIQKEKEIQAERLDTLVALYEKMEPKKAGPMLEKMDKDLIVALFKRLKNKQVTQILENMAPEKSVEITEYFGRIGSAREYDILKEVNKSLQDAFDKCKSH